MMDFVDIDPSEFDCIDEHIDQELQDELDDEFIEFEVQTHSFLWEDLSEINEDDIPY